MAIDSKGTRAYPSIPRITGDPKSHTLALEAIREAIEIHERRTKNVLDSFVRLRELVELQVLKSRGGAISLNGILDKLVRDEIFVEIGKDETYFFLDRLHRIFIGGTPTGPERAWDDYLAPLVNAQGVGGSVPDWVVFRDGIKAYEFEAASEQELWINIHIRHDYAIGTQLFPHIHWAPNTTSTGVVRWGFEYTIAKGHNQEAFPASVTVYLEDTISVNSQYEHRVIESSDADSFNSAEADSMVLARVFRDSTHINDTFPDPVFAFQLDLHYQKDRYGTRNKTPGFDDA